LSDKQVPDGYGMTGNGGYPGGASTRVEPRVLKLSSLGISDACGIGGFFDWAAEGSV